MLSHYALLAERPSLAHIVMYELGLLFVVVSLCFARSPMMLYYPMIEENPP